MYQRWLRSGLALAGAAGEDRGDRRAAEASPAARRRHRPLRARARQSRAAARNKPGAGPAARSRHRSGPGPTGAGPPAGADRAAWPGSERGCPPPAAAPSAAAAGEDLERAGGEQLRMPAAKRSSGTGPGTRPRPGRPGMLEVPGVVIAVLAKDTRAHRRRPRRQPARIARLGQRRAHDRRRARAEPASPATTRARVSAWCSQVWATFS